MTKKSKTIVLILTLVLFTLTLAACDNERQMGAWIDNHIEKSSDKLENRIQKSQDRVGQDDSTMEAQDDSEQCEQQSRSWIGNHIQDSGDKLIQHIEQLEDRLDLITGKD